MTAEKRSLGTGWRFAAALAWITLTVGYGSTLLYSSILRPGWGPEPALAQNLRAAAAYGLGGGLLISSGPVALWVYTRRRVWLVTSIILLVLTIAWAGGYYLDSRSAPIDIIR